MNANGFLSDDEYRTVYGLVPRLCVDLVIQAEPGLLLVRRKQKPFVGLWHLPGGRVRKGETLEQAAQRIAQHELGTGVDINGYAGAIEFLSDQGDLGEYHSVSVALSCYPHQKAGRIQNVGWFWELPGDPMHPTHREFVCKTGLLTDKCPVCKHSHAYPSQD